VRVGRTSVDMGSIGRLLLVAPLALAVLACMPAGPTGSPAGTAQTVKSGGTAVEPARTRFEPTPTPAASCPPYAPVEPSASAVAELGPSASLPPSPARGERFVLEGVLLSWTCDVRANQSFSAWHTDAHAHYGPTTSSDELICCYYQATLTTDEDGRFELRTVRAASDPDPNGEIPAHIHIALEPADDFGPGIVLVFADDPTHGPVGPRDLEIPMERRTDADGEYWFSFVVIRI
jgi:hypothetical protein